MNKKSKSGYRKKYIPLNARYCIYCGGAGCDKCAGRGYYFPDLEQPIDPLKKYES